MQQRNNNQKVEMGTGWSQEGASQSEASAQQSELEPHQSTPSRIKGVCNTVESKPISDHNEEKAKAKQTAQKIPHNFEDILKDADCPRDKSSAEEKLGQLQAGILLNQKKKASLSVSLVHLKHLYLYLNIYLFFLSNGKFHTSRVPLLWQKYWVDKNSNNCFMVYARDLSICWVEDLRYWKWTSMKETRYTYIHIKKFLFSLNKDAYVANVY